MESAGRRPLAELCHARGRVDAGWSRDGGPTVYRGYEEVATGFAAIWETWEEFRCQEFEVRDLGDSVLWLGRVKMKGGASHVELDQEFAIHAVVRNGKVTAVRTFLAWEEAVEASR